MAATLCPSFHSELGDENAVQKTKWPCTDMSVINSKFQSFKLKHHDFTVLPRKMSRAGRVDPSALVPTTQVSLLPTTQVFLLLSKTPLFSLKEISQHSRP